MSSGLTPGGRNHSVRIRTERGFTLIEALTVVAVISIMTAMAIPLVRSTLAYYDLQGAVSAVSGTIQATRYRAISDGYPYQVTLSKLNHTYQVAKCPTWDSTSPTVCPKWESEGAVAFGSPKVTLGNDTVITFRSSGIVVFAAGSSPVTLSRDVENGSTKTKSITVSNYGSVKVQ